MIYVSIKQTIQNVNDTSLFIRIEFPIEFIYLFIFSLIFAHQIYTVKYVPNIRRCIGVGGLNDPHAKNTIFVDETIFSAQINTIKLSILMRQSFFCAVKFKNMMHLFDKYKVREKCQQ